MNIVQFNGVGFGYPGQAPILSGIHLTLNQGERLLILGANGCGKSSLAFLASGVLTPTSGTIERNSLKIGLVFQNSRLQLVGATVEEDLAFGLSVLQTPTLQIKEKVNLYLELFGLSCKRHHNTNLLSGGEMRRLALAGILITEPELLILDEPLTMLDEANRCIFLEYLKTSLPLNTAVLWMDHDLRNLKYFQYYCLLNSEGNLQRLTERELCSLPFLRAHRLEPAPLQYLEWKYPGGISNTVYGLEQIKINDSY